jgi:polyisoprenoid-binding protein YceI
MNKTHTRYRGTLLHPKSKKITAGLQVTTTIKRSDFKVGMSDPFDQIKDEVTIKADGEFPRQ